MSCSSFSRDSSRLNRKPVHLLTGTRRSRVFESASQMVIFGTPRLTWTAPDEFSTALRSERPFRLRACFILRSFANRR